MPERSQAQVSVYAPPPSALAGSSWPQPVRLLDPEPLLALAAIPDHSPKAFTWRRVQHRIVRAGGPERITGEWWVRSSEQLAVRDDWIAEKPEGRRFGSTAKVVASTARRAASLGSSTACFDSSANHERG